MESENNLVPTKNAEPKKKEALIKHRLEQDDEDEVYNTKMIEMTIDNENKINTDKYHEKRDQTNLSSGIFVFWVLNLN